MYIEKIQSPADLKKLDITALDVVADEVRSAVLRRVSMHGGHVGPNLGFVEATVALHYVFDAPKDKLVFDVSHQCYPHKVLTGRAAGFLGDTDAMNAISGYSSPNESPIYDNFEVGHTSTSISLATGLQKARDIHGSDENIIAIIGDGSLSGGEAFEGLDEASELGTGIIIVVNDNEMSIAENHGGIYKNLRALRESGGRCAHNWFKAWGFEYKSVAFVWLKLNKSGKGWFYGLGFWTRGNAEICLLATKGHPKRKSNRVHQFIISPLRGHSQKPDEARDKIIELVGDLPRVELFAREKADGWDAWGNEIDCDLEIEGYCEKTGGDFVVG